MRNGSQFVFNEESFFMKTSRVVSSTAAALLSVVAVSSAWAGTGNGAGYSILQDGTCTLSNAGDICDLSFTLPTQARLGDSSILSYVEQCTDLGNGINF